MTNQQTINIRGGRLMDPLTGRNGRMADIHIAAGQVRAVVDSGKDLPSADIELDATNCIVSPGLVVRHEC